MLLLVMLQTGVVPVQPLLAAQVLEIPLGLIFNKLLISMLTFCKDNTASCLLCTRILSIYPEKPMPANIEKIAITIINSIKEKPLLYNIFSPLINNYL